MVKRGEEVKMKNRDRDWCKDKDWD